MGRTIVKVGDHLHTEIDYHHNEDVLSVEFGSHYIIEVTKVNETGEWKVTNAVDGHGRNAYDELKNENVQIRYTSYLGELRECNFRTFFDSDEPLLVMIKKTGHVHADEYHVIEEDPFDSKYEVMSSVQIEERYKIKL